MKTITCSCPMCKRGRCGVCRPKTVAVFPTIDHGLIKNESDILKLDIIDWNRLNGYWRNPSEALQTITSWFRGHAHYSIMEADLKKAPERNDFPGWNHVGNHEYYGRLYWNWFYHNQEGELHFSDSPDFYGSVCGKSFWGDIGKVSPVALACTQKQMNAGDVWISVDEHRQVIIEPALSIADLWTHTFNSMIGITDEVSIAQNTTEETNVKQMRLF